MPSKLFVQMEEQLSEGEKEFISNVLKDDKTLDVKSVYVAQAQVLATLRLAKEIEASSKSNDKHSNAMKRLTIALVVVGIIQAASAVIQICKP